jgi:hypothetical protein
VTGGWSWRREPPPRAVGRRSRRNPDAVGPGRRVSRGSHRGRLAWRPARAPHDVDGRLQWRATWPPVDHRRRETVLFPGLLGQHLSRCTSPRPQSTGWRVGQPAAGTGCPAYALRRKRDTPGGARHHPSHACSAPRPRRARSSSGSSRPGPLASDDRCLISPSPTLNPGTASRSRAIPHRVGCGGTGDRPPDHLETPPPCVPGPACRPGLSRTRRGPGSCAVAAPPIPGVRFPARGSRSPADVRSCDGPVTLPSAAFGSRRIGSAWGLAASPAPH